MCHKSKSESTARSISRTHVLQTFEEGQTAVSVAVVRMSEEGSNPRLWNGDMGGVNPFRLPEPQIHPFHAFSPDALIGPVWNRRIPGQPNEAYGFGEQFWDRQGMVNPARNSITILEGNSRGIEISIDQQPSSDVTVTITGHAGTDLTVSPSTFTFTSSDWADQTATLTAEHDDDAINDELILTIQGDDGNSSQVAVTIVDDEIIWELTPQVIQEGTRVSHLRIYLRNLGPPSGDVTFTITGHEGTSLAVNPTTLTFPAADWERSREFALTASVDGDDMDDRETLTFTATGGGYDGLTYSMHVVIKEKPPFEELIPEGRSIIFGISIKVRGRFPPKNDLVGTYTGYAGTDLAVSPPNVTYRANSWFGPCFPGGQRWDYCTPSENVEIRAAHDPDDEDDQETLFFEVTDFGVAHQINIRI